jgi:hypothetical protein
MHSPFRAVQSLGNSLSMKVSETRLQALLRVPSGPTSSAGHLPSSLVLTRRPSKWTRGAPAGSRPSM